jgi:hypothetical protein
MRGTGGTLNLGEGKRTGAPPANKSLVEVCGIPGPQVRGTGGTLNLGEGKRTGATRLHSYGKEST